jgi:hypothetical protein
VSADLPQPDMPQPDVAGPQTEPAVTPRPPLPGAPSILDATQRALLAGVLNRLIPPRQELLGAGDLDVGASIEQSMAGSARLRRLLLDGLTAIAIASGRRLFAELDPAAQSRVLEQIEQEHPAFFVALVEHTYRGYYTMPAVHAAIGYESRPPQPLGYRLPPFDPALLDQQRARQPFWRRTS